MQNQSNVLIMGILNVTLDSFSDGGLYIDAEKAVEHGFEMLKQGADIIDVGGESTRPGSLGVDDEEEKRRTVPVIEELLRRAEVKISIDTVKPGVAEAAARAGARMINDVSMLRYGTGLAEVAAEFKCELVLMHSRKTPEDMQEGIKYKDVVKEVNAELLQAAIKAEAIGVAKSNIWLDPGIGFAKTSAHCIELMSAIRETVALGYRVLVGPSRKSFIDKISKSNTHERLGGTAAAVTAAVLEGVKGIRVHDVAVMRQAALVAEQIRRAALTRRCNA